MSAVWDAGFSYWGLFVALGTILVAYGVWMYLTERGEDEDDGTSRQEGPDADPRGQRR